MTVSAIRMMLVLCGIGLAVPESLLSQQQRGEEAPAGIWIAGADGRLRSVQPVRGTAIPLTRARAHQPSAVQVVFFVEHYARSASGAVGGAALAVSRVADALTALGIAPGDIASETAFVQPRYERRLLAGSWEPRRVQGYEAANLVTVTIDRRRALGMVIDHAMGAGATRVVSVNREPVYEER
ncbi:hypothetical protein BH23GEM6_BH23GEM6_19350 [soil metagenome]